jgi:hypothetical protein
MSMPLRPPYENVLPVLVDTARGAGANHLRYNFYRKEDAVSWTLDIYAPSESTPSGNNPITIKALLQDPLLILQQNGFLYIHREQKDISHKGIVELYGKAFVHVYGPEEGESVPSVLI